MLPLLAILVTGSFAPMVSGCSDSPTGSGSCCKVCRDGKACGDTCISKSSTCNKGGGCACNG
jgi:hypothetical protein